MLDHITLLVKDINQSKAFFTQALKPLGYKLVADREFTGGYGIEDKPGLRDFWIKQKEEFPTPPSFTCFAFKATSKQQVDDFYTSALEAGGTDNGGPGYRTKYYPGYYAAFVHDPNGYNIEVVFDDPNPPKQENT